MPSMAKSRDAMAGDAIEAIAGKVYYKGEELLHASRPASPSIVLAEIAARAQPTSKRPHWHQSRKRRAINEKAGSIELRAT